MTKTMIQIDTDVRDEVKSFGNMGETYSDVIKRLCKLAAILQAEKYLMDTEGYTDIKELI